MKRADLNKVRDGLKIGSRVEVKCGHIGVLDDNARKRHKGEVVEKYETHFIVRVNARSGNSWDESFLYKDLIPIDGKVKVKVLEKGKK